MKEENKALMGQYVQEICSHIRWKAVHQQISLEMEDHLYEIIGEHQDQGMEEDQAVKNALAQMGRADTIGKHLNETHKPAPDWIILILITLFSSIGLLAIYLLQQYGEGVGSQMPQLVEKSIGYMIMGIGLGTMIYFIDYRKVQAYSKHLYGCTIIVLLFTLVNGHMINGRPYLSLFGGSINVIEISPYLLIVSLAGIFTDWDWQQPKRIFLGMGLIMIPVLLISMGPSVVAASLFLVAALAMMYFSGARLLHIIGLLSGMIGIFLFSLGGYAYRGARLLSFLNPHSDPNGLGYMTIQSTKVISSAGLWGRGFVEGNIMLPELHTDLIFTYLVHTFGWIVGIFIVAMVIVFIVRLGRMGSLIQDEYGKLMIIGFAVIISLQYIWNILMTLGFAPMVGVGIPFISYSGLSMTVYFAVIGLISSVYKRKNLGFI